MKPRRALVALACLSALALAGCGGSQAAGGSSTAGGTGERLQVVASVYPLQFVAERIGGDTVQVSSLTKPGAEPHDLELTPGDLGSVVKADLVVYLKGFQPAVDQAVGAQAEDKAFDVTAAADLDLSYRPIEEGQQEDGSATDPHFWLDPERLTSVVTALATRMGAADPSHKAAFTANAAALSTELAALDEEFRAGLASCQNMDLVTSHNAFGYLSERYGMKQVGITGLVPESEPAAGELAAVTRFVRDNKVRTIYYETLVSPRIADTVAKETGARTEVLDPIEGLSDRSQGKDYFEVMRSNLANLKTGQPCP